MKKSKFSEEQIVRILKEVEAGAKVGETYRKHGVSEPAYYVRKNRYAGMDVSQLRHLKEVEVELARLKRVYAELALEHHALKDVLSRKGGFLPFRMEDTCWQDEGSAMLAGWNSSLRKPWVWCRRGRCLRMSFRRPPAGSTFACAAMRRGWYVRRAERWIKEAVRAVFRDCNDAEAARAALSAVISWAWRSRLAPFKRLSATLREHLGGILEHFRCGLSNGYAEAMNGLINATKRRARGYGTDRRLITMCYLIGGKLKHLPASPWLRHAAAAT